MEEKKKFKLVSSKKTRYLLPNILTLAGVCLGISSIKFSLDLNFKIISTYDVINSTQFTDGKIPSNFFCKEVLFHLKNEQ